MRDPSPRDPSDFADLNALSVPALTSVWTPAAGNQVRFMGVDISVSVDSSVVFTEETTGRVLWRTPIIPANTPYYRDFYNNGFLLATSKKLQATMSAAGTITGTLMGEVRPFAQN